MKPKTSLFLLYFILAIVISIVAFAVFGLLRFAQEDAAFFIIFLVISGFLLTAVLLTMKTLRKKIRTQSERDLTILNSLKWSKYRDKIHQNTTLQGLLDEWKIPSAEWQKFKTFEKSERKQDIIIQMILIVVIGTPFLMLVREGRFLVSFLVSIAFSILYGIGRNYAEKRKYEVIPGQDVQVFFFEDLVVADNKVFILSEEGINFSNAEVSVKKGLTVLTLESWYYSSKNAKIYSDLKIPVNEKNLPSAQKLVDFYRKKYLSQ